MQMSQFIEALQADLRELAEIGGEELVQATQRLAGAIKQSATLRLIDALTQVALDLSSQLPNGHVEIRLAGQDPQLVYVVEEPSEPVDLRLSVMYQPEPLKIMPTGCKTRRTGPPPQFSHTVSGSEVMDWSFSKRFWQFLHSYSYIGMKTSTLQLAL